MDKMIMSQTIAGIVWTLLSGQPLCILGATGSVLAYTVAIYNRYGPMLGKENFRAMYWILSSFGVTISIFSMLVLAAIWSQPYRNYSWTGAWSLIYTVRMTASDVYFVMV